MNRRIKNKINKGIFYHHNGSMLWKYHAYQPNRNSNSIMLLYDETGNEIYFTKWNEAKKYIRTLPKRKELSFED